MNDCKVTIDEMQYELLVIGTAEGLIAKAQISLFFKKSLESKKTHRKTSIKRKR
jgi:hypothetical protein